MSSKTTKLARTAAACLALAIAACSEGATSRPAPDGVGARTGRRADAIQGGVLDTKSTFAVAVLDDKGGTCSGTLIAPNLVLTARHCVADDSGGTGVDCTKDRFSAPHAPSTLRAATDATAAFDTAAFQAKKIIVPVDTLFCGNDLALIILEKVVPAAVAKPATPAIDPPLTNRAKYGTTFTAIGYGITGPGLNDDGVRRQRTGVALTCIPGDAVIGCNIADFDMKSTELAAGSGLCDGDSGSGAFEPSSLASGSPIVMAVLSRAVDRSGQCVDSIYGRTDTASALLIGAAKEAATIGGYPVPAWADPTGSAQVDGGPTSDGGPAVDPPLAPDAAAAPSNVATTTTGCTVRRPGSASNHATRLGESAMLGLALLVAVASRRASRRRRS